MIRVGMGVTRSFARDVVALSTRYGARATVKATSNACEIWVRDQETDREIVRSVILSFWNDPKVTV